MNIRKWFDNRKGKKQSKSQKVFFELLESSYGFIKIFPLGDDDSDFKKFTEFLFDFDGYFIINKNIVFYNGYLYDNDMIDSGYDKSYFGLNMDEKFLNGYIHNKDFKEKKPKKFKTWICYFYHLYKEEYNFFKFDKSEYLQKLDEELNNYKKISLKGCEKDE